jgi:hypothetical protein
MFQESSPDASVIVVPVQMRILMECGGPGTTGLKFMDFLLSLTAFVSLHLFHKLVPTVTDKGQRKRH